jgi:hypothetical protein
MTNDVASLLCDERLFHIYGTSIGAPTRAAVLTRKYYRSRLNCICA